MWSARRTGHHPRKTRRVMLQGRGSLIGKGTVCVCVCVCVCEMCQFYKVWAHKREVPLTLKRRRRKDGRATRL